MSASKFTPENRGALIERTLPGERLAAGIELEPAPRPALDHPTATFLDDEDDDADFSV